MKQIIYIIVTLLLIVGCTSTLTISSISNNESIEEIYEVDSLVWDVDSLKI